MSESYPPLAPETLDLLGQASTATISYQLTKRGVSKTFMVGPRPLRPQDRMVGIAFTLRYVPSREDISAGVHYDNRTNVQRLAIERVGPGEVLVIDARGELGAGTLGNILTARLRVRGAAGIVTDGAVRDAASVAAEPLPTYCAAANALLSATVHYPADMQVPIGCGGVLVMPGDVLVGDSDGVLVIPRHLADDVARDAAEQEAIEGYVLTRIRDGAELDGTYPPNDATRAEFARQRSARPST
jgi:regulator of RNase E activity RraA